MDRVLYMGSCSVPLCIEKTCNNQEHTHKLSLEADEIGAVGTGVLSIFPMPERVCRKKGFEPSRLGTFGGQMSSAVYAALLNQCNAEPSCSKWMSLARG